MRNTPTAWQVEAYANQMEPILDALKYLTPYGFDALTYIILTRLTLDRAKVCSCGVGVVRRAQHLPVCWQCACVVCL